MVWRDLRGRVVVLQTWTNKTSAGRSIPVRLAKLAEEFPNDLAVILLHTPESATKLPKLLEKRPVDLPLALDEDGAYCDEIGFFKRPTNLVIDRQGTVRYAGLSPGGVQEAVAALAAAPYEPGRDPETRPGAETPEPVDFPRFDGNVGKANRVVGQRAPDLQLNQWITPAPNTDGKVVVVDFWATWCGPCIASIPHMNALANRFRDDVVIIGISAEKSSDFEKGMRRKRLTADRFQYSLALDPGRTLGRFVGNKTIPYGIVMSGDGVVRWQGHPGGLDETTLAAIVRSNNGGGGGGDGDDTQRPRRWRDEQER
jgi:thiol-disulfide isomerase/thioredoxin